MNSIFLVGLGLLNICPATTREYEISCDGSHSLCCFMVRKVLENVLKKSIRYGKFDAFVSFFHRSLFYGFARRESLRCFSSFWMIEWGKTKNFRCSRKWGKLFSAFFIIIQHSAETASIFSLHPSREPYANVVGIKKLDFEVYGGAWQQVTGISPTTSREMKIK